MLITLKKGQVEVVGVCVHCVESQLILAETCMDDGIHLNIGRGRATYRDHQKFKTSQKKRRFEIPSEEGLILCRI